MPVLHDVVIGFEGQLNQLIWKTAQGYENYFFIYFVNGDNGSIITVSIYIKGKQIHS